MNVTRLSSALLIVSGALWGVWYFGMDLVGWGEPGTAGYDRYETYNRLAPVVLALLISALALFTRSTLLSRAGKWGTRIAVGGLSAMILGSVLEFWFFTFASYAPGSLRGMGWTVYCLGLLGFYIGTATLGASRMRADRRSALLLSLWLPSAAVLGGLSAVLGTHLPSFSIGVALGGLGIALLARPCQAIAESRLA